VGAIMAMVVEQVVVPGLAQVQLFPQMMNLVLLLLLLLGLTLLF